MILYAPVVLGVPIGYCARLNDMAHIENRE